MHFSARQCFSEIYIGLDLPPVTFCLDVPYSSLCSAFCHNPGQDDSSPVFGSPYDIGPSVVLSVSDVGVLWPNGWMNQDVTWYGPGDIGLDRDPAPLQHSSPHFSAHAYCGQTVAHLSNC